MPVIIIKIAAEYCIYLQIPKKDVNYNCLFAITKSFLILIDVFKLFR